MGSVISRSSARERGSRPRAGRTGCASKRSRTPPWPGSSVPKSFTPRSRLIIDSQRSPSGAMTATAMPSASASVRSFHGVIRFDDHERRRRSTRPCRRRALDVLFGEIAGASRRLPELRADEVADDVVGDDAEHDAEDEADAVLVAEQQAREAAEARRRRRSPSP